MRSEMIVYLLLVTLLSGLTFGLVMDWQDSRERLGKAEQELEEPLEQADEAARIEESLAAPQSLPERESPVFDVMATAPPTDTPKIEPTPTATRIPTPAWELTFPPMGSDVAMVKERGEVTLIIEKGKPVGELPIICIDIGENSITFLRQTDGYQWDLEYKAP
jgi:hypothetical protein